MCKAFKSLILKSTWVLVFVLTSAACHAHPLTIEKPLNVSEYKGKYVIISYWATWCSVCQEEIPLLNTFYKAHRNEVAMFGVNYDDEGNLLEHIQEIGVDFPTLKHNPMNKGKITVLPTLAIIGPDGHLRRILTGLHSPQDIEHVLHELKQGSPSNGHLLE